MAKKSKIARNEQRQVTVAKWATLRADLKRTSVDPAATPQERACAMRRLHQLPRDASPVRVRNRDVADGRPRGYLRTFGISRITFRDMAHRGELPGVTKSSW